MSYSLTPKSEYDRYAPVLNGVLDGQELSCEALHDDFEVEDIAKYLPCNNPEVVRAIVLQMTSHGWDRWAARLARLWSERNRRYIMGL